MAKATKKSSPVNIFVPDALQERIKRLRVILQPQGLDVNVSAICRAALEDAVAKLEKKHIRREGS